MGALCFRCSYCSRYLILYIGRYGCTNITISDQGREFVNRVSENLFAQTRTEHRISTTYHPQTNGLVECYNQTLQRSLLKLVNKQQNNWDEFINGVLLAYRTSKQMSTQFTPFVLQVCCSVVIHAPLSIPWFYHLRYAPRYGYSVVLYKLC